MSEQDDMGGVFDPAPVLATLKDFQLRTAEYVFERMYGPEGVDRFLVADEVGLGKTLVAKGIVAKVVEQLSKDPKRRIDVVYLCANRDIARQNIDRLNLFGKDRVSQANRLTLLPLHLKHLQSGPNFIAFTPATALDLRGATGIAEERALLYWMVSEAWEITGAALRNFFQVGVGNDRWDREINRLVDLLNALKDGEIDAGLRNRFMEEISKRDGLRARLDAAIQGFQRRRDQPGNVPREDRELRDPLIGEFRECLARACLSALEPDLIILDEFQRFSSLLASDKSEEGDQVAELGQQFLSYEGAKILLLSATPYKPYTTAAEGVHEDHYKNFLQTAGFLLKDSNALEGLQECLKAFNEALFDTGPNGAPRLRAAKLALEARLRRHIVRTERLAVAADRDGMIEEVVLPACRLEHQDLQAFAAVDALARELDQPDVLEYWKSAPYFLNFMEREGYVFKSALLAHLEEGGKSKVDARSFREATLQADVLAKFGALDPQNAKLRALVAESLDRGAWKVLWIPPSISYYRAPGTAYEEAVAHSITKILVFSNWRFAPRAIAAMLSYEAERRIVTLAGGQARYDSLSTRSRRGLLRFSLDEAGGPRDLNHLVLLYPSPALCELIDPLEEAKRAASSGGELDQQTVLQIAMERAGRVIEARASARKIDSERDDQQWYVSAMAQADRVTHGGAIGDWFRQRQPWSTFVADDEGDEAAPGAFRIHVDTLAQLAQLPRSTAREGRFSGVRAT